MRLNFIMTSCALALLLTGCATAPAQFSGGILTNSAGMTLYSYDKDVVGSGKSACNGPCAKNWPPLMATAEDKPGGEWSIITRDDGGKQWAYKGKPVYSWVKDQKPGDRTGDGFGGAWRVIAGDAPFTREAPESY